jgi:hypothetical protein
MRQVVLIGCLLASPANATDQKLNEAFFPGQLLEPGDSISVRLEGLGKHARNFKVERYSGTGTLLDSVIRRTDGEPSVEVLLGVASKKAEFGWLRVEYDGKGPAARVSLTEEHRSGSGVTSSTNLAVPRYPPSEKFVRSARRGSTHTGYWLDVSSTRCTAFFFVNLSDYSVQVGACQADTAGCAVPALPYTVRPLEQKMFLADRKKRYFAVSSTPGYSAGAGLYFEQISSAISFSPSDEVARHEGTATVDPALGRVANERTPDATTDEICPACGMLDNSEAAEASPAAAAALAADGHASTPQELARLVQAGQASMCMIITTPPKAQISVDGNTLG